MELCDDPDSERSRIGRPTKMQASAKTESLLDTARALFCSKGFAATSIDEIATVMRSSKHTIYRRYENKLVLLEAVVERDVCRFRQGLLDAAAAATDDPLEALKAMARTYFRFSASPGYSVLYAAIALESASSAHLRRRLQEWAGTSLQPMFVAIKRASRVAGWQAVDISELGEILIDLLDGQANRAKRKEVAPGSLDLERLFEAR